MMRAAWSASSAAAGTATASTWRSTTASSSSSRTAGSPTAASTSKTSTPGTSSGPRPAGAQREARRSEPPASGFDDQLADPVDDERDLRLLAHLGAGAGTRLADRPVRLDHDPK